MIRAVGTLATLLGATVIIGFGHQAGASDNHASARAAAHHKATCNPGCPGTFFEGHCQCECGVQCSAGWSAPQGGPAPAPVSGIPVSGYSGYSRYSSCEVSACGVQPAPVSGIPVSGYSGYSGYSRYSGYSGRGFPAAGYPVCGVCEVPVAEIPVCEICGVQAAPVSGIPQAPVMPPAPVSGVFPTPTPTPVIPPAPVSGVFPAPTPTPVIPPAPVSGAIPPAPVSGVVTPKPQHHVPTHIETVPVHAPVVVPTRLPTTGAPIAGDAAIGGGLIVAGLALCLAGRPKRRRA